MERLEKEQIEGAGEDVRPAEPSGELDSLAQYRRSVLLAKDILGTYDL